MGRLIVRLALAAHCFLLDHRHSGPIHFGIENRNRLAADDGQIQLDGLLHFFLFTQSDVFSNCFGDALNRFGCHFQTGQYFHLCAAVIEGGRPGPPERACGARRARTRCSMSSSTSAGNCP
jgi:hypothetical protein